jgi:hypothetical protein
MILFTLLQLLSGFGLALASNLNGNTTFIETLNKNPCSTEIKKQLETWKALQEWNERPSLDPLQATRLFLGPTQKIGTWIEIRFPAEQGASALLFQKGNSEKISWSTDCKTEHKTTQSAQSPSSQTTLKGQGGFSDLDLITSVEQNKKGIVFVWSPHMPCSVKGLHSIQKTAEVMHLPLIALLDPASNRAFAKKLAQKEKFPDTVLRTVDSMELLLRGMTQYLPSVQIFSNQVMQGPVFRGFQDNTNYQRFVESNLQKENRQ